MPTLSVCSDVTSFAGIGELEPLLYVCCAFARSDVTSFAGVGEFERLLCMFVCLHTVTSRHSLVSESSSDYALPPDEVSIQNESGDSEPEHKLLKFTHVSEQRQQVSISADRSVSVLTGVCSN